MSRDRLYRLPHGHEWSLALLCLAIVEVIVNILDADADALGPNRHATAYKVGKAGGLLLTRTLAETEGPYGITVNAVSPGTLDNSEKQPPLSQIPLGRVGTPRDLLGAVVYLSGDTASYITGAHLKVSGGYLIDRSR